MRFGPLLRIRLPKSRCDPADSTHSAIKKRYPIQISSEKGRAEKPGSDLIVHLRNHAKERRYRVKRNAWSPRTQVASNFINPCDTQQRYESPVDHRSRMA